MHPVNLFKIGLAAPEAAPGECCRRHILVSIIHFVARFALIVLVVLTSPHDKKKYH
jgi:hypothetical protein